MKILIGTKNPGKIKGAKEAFKKYFDNIEMQEIEVTSDVREQPVNEEILKGAKNRISNLKKYAAQNNIEVDYYIASEAGIMNLLGEWINVNIAVIENKEGLQSVGLSQGFQIPNKYVDEILNSDLGSVMDKIFKEKELSKQNGGINLLTQNEITRIDLTKNAFIMALIKYINGDVWK